MFFWNSCFFDDPVDVGNLISGSFAFAKTSLNILKFTVHKLLKPGWENFESFMGSQKKTQKTKKINIAINFMTLVDLKLRFLFLNNVYQCIPGLMVSNSVFGHLIASLTCKNSNQRYFPVSSIGKESPAIQETPVGFVDQEDPLEKGIGYPLQYSWTSLVAQLVKNLHAVQEPWLWSLGWEDPQEKGKATHPSILAWRIPWTVYSPWDHKDFDTTERFSKIVYIYIYIYIFFFFLSLPSPSSLPFLFSATSTFWLYFCWSSFSFSHVIFDHHPLLSLALSRPPVSSSSSSIHLSRHHQISFSAWVSSVQMPPGPLLPLLLLEQLQFTHWWQGF